MTGNNIAQGEGATPKRNMSRRQFLAVAGIMGLTIGSGSLLSACQGQTMQTTKDGEDTSSDTHTVTDMSGTDVTVPTTITAYADGWYAHNEISIMLNGAKGMVATHCDPKTYQWMYKVCPEMNNATATFGKDFNFEDLASLNPQVVFDSSNTLRDKCDEVGIPLINCMFSDYEKMEDSIRLTASVFGGDAPDIADAYCNELEDTLSNVKSKTDGLSDADRPKVMHGNSVYTMILDGTDTIIDTWIQACGGVNAVQESTKGNAQQTFSMEQITAWDPDIIITGKADEVDKIMQDPNWQSITAVKNGDVYVNPKGVFGWDRYGVESLLQLKWASHLMHPDMFDDVNVEQSVKDFYHTYLNYDLSDHEVDLIMQAKNPD